MEEDERRHAEPPRCAHCEYDRTGLPKTDEESVPCPECGSGQVAPPWPGWRRVIGDGTVVPLISFGLGVALPIGAMAVADPAGYDLPRLVSLFAGLGLVVSLVFGALMPVASGSMYAVAIRSHNRRPGQLRIVLACWGVLFVAWAAMLGVALAIAMGMNQVVLR